MNTPRSAIPLTMVVERRKRNIKKGANERDTQTARHSVPVRQEIGHFGVSSSKPVLRFVPISRRSIRPHPGTWSRRDASTHQTVDHSGLGSFSSPLFQRVPPIEVEVSIFSPSAVLKQTPIGLLLTRRAPFFLSSVQSTRLSFPRAWGSLSFCVTVLRLTFLTDSSH